MSAAMPTTEKQARTSSFNMSISPEKKHDLEYLFSSLGMTLPEAVDIFFEQDLLVGGIPFDVRIPRYNYETEEAMQEARDIASGKIEAKAYYSADELFAELDAEID